MVLPQIAQLDRGTTSRSVRSSHSDRRRSCRPSATCRSSADSRWPTCPTAVCRCASRSMPVANRPPIDLARSLTGELWDRAARFRLHATPLADIDGAGGGRRRVSTHRSLLADVADNPGGGAPANSTFVLRALVEAGLPPGGDGTAVRPRPWWTPRGRPASGHAIDVVFNDGSERPLATPFAARPPCSRSSTSRCARRGACTPAAPATRAAVVRCGSVGSTSVCRRIRCSAPTTTPCVTSVSTRRRPGWSS